MMRTRIALAAAATLFAGAVPVMPAAPAQAKANPAIEQCRAILPLLPESNLGECLSWITVAENGAGGEVSHHCDALQENSPEIFEMLFLTKSECIQAFGGRGPFKPR
jgi:hypothetical protein